MTMLQDLPDWVAPATDPPKYTSVGINRDGEFYLYGEVPARPGPTIPAVRGYLLDTSIQQRAARGLGGPRNYLETTLVSPTREHFVLRLPCKASHDEASGQLRTPYPVRSMLGALRSLLRSGIQVDDTAIKLQTRRGQQGFRPTFIQLFPYDTAGNELAEVRAEPIGPSEDHLVAAVNEIRAALDLPHLVTLPDT
jgi:hypothetical protein